VLSTQISWSSAGRNAINGNANFIGSVCWKYHNKCTYQSNFMGNLAGNQAINAYNSNFFGYNSGINASGANSSNFFAPMLVNTHQGTSNFIGGAAGLMQQMRSIQISLVLRLVLVQQMRIIQISLVLKLVM
jgi:hypothetical protein